MCCTVTKLKVSPAELRNLQDPKALTVCPEDTPASDTFTSARQAGDNPKH